MDVRVEGGTLVVRSLNPGTSATLLYAPSAGCSAVALPTWSETAI